MDEVVVTDYDPRWPELYAQETVGLRQALGASLLTLEHIGSTAVPSLAAKPVIDIQAVVQSVAGAQSAAPALALQGWHQGVFALDPERRLYFRKYNAQGVRTGQLHIYEPTHPAASAHLLFRNYLRAHPEEAALYASLKRELAQQFPTDRLAYNDAKTAYIEAVVAKARG
jgi:GrpB-like predicted nucleotidyltransferase (UPF0157 family)